MHEPFYIHYVNHYILVAGYPQLFLVYERHLSSHLLILDLCRPYPLFYRSTNSGVMFKSVLFKPFCGVLLDWNIHSHFHVFTSLSCVYYTHVLHTLSSIIFLFLGAMEVYRQKARLSRISPLCSEKFYPQQLIQLALDRTLPQIKFKPLTTVLFVCACHLSPSKRGLVATATYRSLSLFLCWLFMSLLAVKGEFFLACAICSS